MQEKELFNSLGSRTTHKSSSNESLLSKQGAKTNRTRSPSAPPLPRPSLSPLLLVGIFMRKEEMQRCNAKLEQSGKYYNLSSAVTQNCKKKNHYFKGFYTNSSNSSRLQILRGLGKKGCCGSGQAPPLGKNILTIKMEHFYIIKDAVTANCQFPINNSRQYKSFILVILCGVTVLQTKENPQYVNTG